MSTATDSIDFINNYTSLIHGHAYGPITEAVQAQVAKGHGLTPSAMNPNSNSVNCSASGYPASNASAS